MYERILVPIDGSTTSERGLDEACAVAARLGSVVRLIHVVDDVSLIMSAGGLTEGGLFNSNSLLVEAERRMIASVDEVVVAVDSTKFGHSELVCLCELQAIHRIVTDSGLSQSWRQRIVDLGIDLIIANER